MSYSETVRWKIYLINQFFREQNRDYLLSPKWKRLKESDNAMEGHCYIAAEALWHLTDRKLKPKCASYQEDGEKKTHWWLENDYGEIFDPSAEQYLPDFPPYNLGRGCGFLTIEPSKRAVSVIQGVWNVNQYLSF